MSDYIMSTGEVRDAFVGTGGEDSYEAFDRWLDAMKAEAWEEGWIMGDEYASEMEAGSPSKAEREFSLGGNPYR